MRHWLTVSATSVLLGAAIVAAAPATGAVRAASSPDQSHQPVGGFADRPLADAPSGLRAAARRTFDSPQVSGGFIFGQQTDQLGSAVAVSGKRALIGAPGVNNGAGAVYVFTQVGQRWQVQFVITDPPNEPGAEFGTSVALNGNIALIGAPGAGGMAGAAYQFAKAGSSWRLRATIKSPQNTLNSFGDSLALSSSVAVIGAFRAPSTNGAAYLYAHVGEHWRLEKTLSHPTKDGNSDFAASVAVSGSTVVVGTFGSDSVYVYTHAPSGWKLQATVTRHKDFFGNVIAISGSTLFVGAANEADFYTRSGASWALRATFPIHAEQSISTSESATISAGLAVLTWYDDNGYWKAFPYALAGGSWHAIASFRSPGQAQSYVANVANAVAVDGKNLIVGSAATYNTGGAAYPFVRSGNRWVRQPVLADPYGLPGNDRGATVAISGSTAVIGAPGYKGQIGAAYIYVKSNGKWRQKATLHNPIRNPVDAALTAFGESVAVSGSTIVVGTSTVIFDNRATADYVYMKSGQRWRLQARIPAPRLTNFGSPVAISGATILIGGSSVYAFVRSGEHWRQQARLSTARDIVAMSMSGDTALLSRPGKRDSGIVGVYVRSGRRWHRQTTLDDPRSQPNDGFGYSVAISGNTAVVGAPGSRGFAGEAYFYARSGRRWRRMAAVTIPPAADRAGGFGGSVAMTGTGRGVIALVSGLSVSGLAYTRTRCASAFEYVRPQGSWRELAKIVDPDCTSYDEFGDALALSGTTALIGAPGTDHNAGRVYLQIVPKP
jgi:FG-GAP repeat